MRGKNTLTAWIMAGIGAVFVLWLAVLIAPYAEGGLPGILLNMNEITAHPFRLELCADTGKAVGIFLGGYALVLLYIFSSQKNFRHGEEHGSAKWENVYLLNHRLHDKEHPDENRILSRHLSITTDQRKLDKNLFTLVIGGSGSRKTRAYVKPNLLQCNSSYIIMDPKGELLRDIGNVFKAEGYKIRVFDLIICSAVFGITHSSILNGKATYKALSRTYLQIPRIKRNMVVMPFGTRRRK